MFSSWKQVRFPTFCFKLLPVLLQLPYFFTKILKYPCIELPYLNIFNPWGYHCTVSWKLKHAQHLNTTLFSFLTFHPNVQYTWSCIVVNIFSGRDTKPGHWLVVNCCHGNMEIYLNKSHAILCNQGWLTFYNIPYIASFSSLDRQGWYVRVIMHMTYYWDSSGRG